MTLLSRVLRLLAHHGRSVLIAGLVIGIAWPDLALAVKPWLPAVISFLLLVAAIRIRPAQALGTLGDMRRTLLFSAVYQVAIPSILALIFAIVGFTAPLATALILMAAASSITGSPNLTVLSGHDPAPALRLLIVGTVLLPLTVIPVFWLSPVLDTAGTITAASTKLLGLIVLAGLIAFAVRRFLMPHPDRQMLQAIDGVSAVGMAVAVIGLTSAIGPAITAEPLRLIGTLTVAFAANFGLQLITFFGLGRLGFGHQRAAYAIVAGNRNMALFLAALPVAVTDPILLFIGCYQVPMYLTPLLLGHLYQGGPEYS